MYKEWPFFQSTVDLIEMILAKGDARIAELYDHSLVADPEERALGAQLREMLHATTAAILEVRITDPCTRYLHLPLYRLPNPAPKAPCAGCMSSILQANATPVW